MNDSSLKITNFDVLPDNMFGDYEKSSNNFIQNDEEMFVSNSISNSNNKFQLKLMDLDKDSSYSTPLKK